MPMESRFRLGLEFLLGLLMLVGVALNFANVFGRYVLGSPIFWAEEVLVLLTIWGVFIGLVVVAWNGEHLAMDLFSSRLTGWPKRLLNGTIAATMVVVCGFVAVQSWTIVSLFLATEAVSVGAQIPKAIPHGALLVGFGLTALAVVVRIRVYLRGTDRR
jgi:TRAP-type C4-dicarboxylate transport system permease small subunit